MNRTLPTLTAALLLALAGCGDDKPTSEAAASPTPAATTAAPTPAADHSRDACHLISATEGRGITAHLDKGVAASVATIAAQSTNPGIAGAGQKLADVAAVADALEDPRGNPNLDVAEAWLDLADACGGLYGDGPW